MVSGPTLPLDPGLTAPLAPNPATPELALAQYSRFVQRIRRRYGPELHALAPGLPGRQGIAELIASLRRGGRPLPGALRVARQLVLERLCVLDVECGATVPEVTRAMTELAEATLELALQQALDEQDARFGAPRNAAGERIDFWVIGIGQEGKTGDETQAAYDGFTVLAHRRTRAVATKHVAAPAAPAARAERAERAARAEPAPARKTTRRKAAPAPAPLPALPEKAQAILRALPELVRGEVVELRVAAERLRDAGLLSKSGSSTKLFGQFAELFELTPHKAPNHVRALAAAGV